MKKRIYEILSDPPEGDYIGKIVSIFILALIALNVFVGILETVPSLYEKYHTFFFNFELVSVLIFSLEYLLRLWSCTSVLEYQHPIKGRYKQMVAPMSIVDFLAIAPFYIQLIFSSSVDLRFVRALRLFRLFRIFRIGKLANSFKMLGGVMSSNREPLLVSFAIVIIVTVLAANVMYLVEHDKNPEFASIPDALWWAIITITTIGYGDIYPITVMGRIVGGIIGFLGICVFALPVGIIGAGFVNEMDKHTKEHKQKDCPHCGKSIE